MCIIDYEISDLFNAMSLKNREDQGSPSFLFIYNHGSPQIFLIFIIYELACLLGNNSRVVSCCLIWRFLFFLIWELPWLGKESGVISHCLLYRFLFFLYYLGIAKTFLGKIEEWFPVAISRNSFFIFYYCHP